MGRRTARLLRSLDTAVLRLTVPCRLFGWVTTGRRVDGFGVEVLEGFWRGPAWVRGCGFRWNRMVSGVAIRLRKVAAKCEGR